MAYADFLNKSVTIKTYAKGAADGTGGYAAATWSALYRRVPAQFVLVSKKGDAAVLAFDKETVFADYFIYIEHRSGIKEGDRVIWQGRTFEIKLVGPWQESGRFLKLTCVEKGRLE